jgi:hypothetical protein
VTPQVTVESVGGHLRELPSAAAAGLGGTVVALGWAYCRCRSAGLAPGRASGARRDYALDLRMAFILEKLI